MYWQRVLDNCVAISALEGKGVKELLHMIEELIPYQLIKMKFKCPARAGDLISKIYRNGKVYSKEYKGEEVIIEAEVDKMLAHSLKAYSF